MKIAILTSGILPVPATEGGAVETLIDHVLNHNANTGQHEFTVFSVMPKPGTPAPDTPHTKYVYIPTNTIFAKIRRQLRLRLAKPGYYNYFIHDFYLSCRQRLLRESWDAIIVENRPGYAIDLRRYFNGPIILHQHLDSLNTGTRQGKDICHALTHVIGVSDYICRRVDAIGTHVPTTTVYNGIDIRRFSDATPERRSDYNLKPDDFVLVYTGRIDPIKGIRELIAAMSLLRDIPHLHLIIIGGSFYGSAMGGDATFFEQLRQEAEPIHERIHFTGFVPYAQVPALLKMANLAVMPSTCQEAFQLTIVEAMAAGLPIVTTNSGAVPELCTGVATIVEQGPQLARRLADAIVQLVNAPQRRQEMADEGTKRAQKFSHEAYSGAFLDALGTIMAQKT